MNRPLNRRIVPTAPRDLQRLRVLRQQDSGRSWASLDEERVCVVCCQQFRGREITLQVKDGKLRCECPTPGCSGELRHFVRPGNPLVDGSVWAEWMLALEDEDLDTATSA